MSAASDLTPHRGVSASAWYALVILTVGAILSYTDRLILNVLVDDLKLDLHLDDLAVSLAQGAAFAIVYAIAGIPFGLLADAKNRRNILLIGAGVWSLGTLACGFAQDLTHLVVARCIVGVGEASFLPAALSLLRDSFPEERRGLAFGSLFMGVSIGVGASLIVGAGLLTILPSQLDWPFLPSGSPWRGVLIILGAIGPILMLAIAFITEPPRKPAASKAAQGDPLVRLKYLFGRAGWVLIILALAAVAEAAGLSWAPSFFLRELTFTNAQVAGILGPCAIIAGAAGYMSGGLIADAAEIRGVRQARLFVTFISAIGALACAGFVFLGGFGAIAGYTGFVFFIAVLNVAAATELMGRVPSSMQGLTSSVLSFTAILTGLASGPTLVALATPQLGSVGLAIFAISALSLAPAIIVALFLRLRAGDSTPSEDAELSARI